MWVCGGRGEGGDKKSCKGMLTLFNNIYWNGEYNGNGRETDLYLSSNTTMFFSPSIRKSSSIQPIFVDGKIKSSNWYLLWG